MTLFRKHLEINEPRSANLGYSGKMSGTENQLAGEKYLAHCKLFYQPVLFYIFFEYLGGRLNNLERAGDYRQELLKQAP